MLRKSFLYSSVVIKQAIKTFCLIVGQTLTISNFFSYGPLIKKETKKIVRVSDNILTNR